MSGATIAWSATNGLQFSACSGASSCSVLSDEAGESSSWVTPTATGQSTITDRSRASLLLAAADSNRQRGGDIDHARCGRGDADALDWARRDAGRSSNCRSAGPGRPAAECNHQFCRHPRHSLAFCQQRNHQRLGIRHHHRKSHESKHQRPNKRLRRSKQFAVHRPYVFSHARFVLDTANGKRIVAGRTHGADISASGDASDRRVELPQIQ